MATFNGQDLKDLLDAFTEEDNALRQEEEDAAETIAEDNSVKSIDAVIKRKQRIQDIKTRAFSQALVDLSDYMLPSHIKGLAAAVVESIDKMHERYTNYVTARCNKILSAQIPRRLIRAYNDWPESFIKATGFIYVTEEDNFYVKLDLPYYFKQGTEQRIIEHLGIKYSGKIVNAIARAKHYAEKRRVAEAEFHIKIAQLPYGTYGELLKAYPFWFDLLLKTL